jgi:5-methylcytosine-specific restriction endonuclease McrA
MKCKSCNKEFIKIVNSQKYCSLNCSKKIRKEQQKNWKKEHYQKHKIEISQKKKKFYQLNKEKIKEYRKKHYQKDKVKIKEYQTENKEKISKWQKEYQINPTGIYHFIKFGAKKRIIDFNLEKENFIKWYNNQKQECYYCSRTLEEIKKDNKESYLFKSRLSIDRKDNKKGYELNNIVLACGRCNHIKSNYFTAQEMLKIGKVLYTKGKNNENK